MRNSSLYIALVNALANFSIASIAGCAFEFLSPKIEFPFRLSEP